MIRRPQRAKQRRSSAASDGDKRPEECAIGVFRLGGSTLFLMITLATLLRTLWTIKGTLVWPAAKQLSAFAFFDMTVKTTCKLLGKSCITIPNGPVSFAPHATVQSRPRSGFVDVCSHGLVVATMLPSALPVGPINESNRRYRWLLVAYSPPEAKHMSCR